ncbi:MAG: C-terminal binding protein [Chloroflexi bacterium]|nr:C-terminal binding protein [Chloroflexota bacterium]
MARFKVVVTDYDWDSLDIERAILAGVDAELVALQCKTEAEVAAAVRDADAVIPQYAHVTRRAIEEMEHCQIIARSGIGVDIVDVDAATERGIWVTNVPSYCVDEVADHAWLLLLAAARKLFAYAGGVQQGRWGWQLGKPVPRLSGKTLGLVGFGKIARAIHRRATGFGLDVVAYDPYVSSQDVARAGARKVDFADLLRTSDFVIIQVPLTPETHHLFDERALRAMKPGAFLVNTARGPIVQDEALYRALTEGWIAGAAVDDIEEEPAKVRDWKPTAPLLGLANFLLTPHMAWYSEEACVETKTVSAREIVRVLGGGRPEHPVNRPVGK